MADGERDSKDQEPVDEPTFQVSSAEEENTTKAEKSTTVKERNQMKDNRSPPTGEAAAFRRVFDLLDTDSDGFISPMELRSALREPEIKKFIARTYVLKLLVEKEDHEQIFLSMDSELCVSIASATFSFPFAMHI